MKKIDMEKCKNNRNEKLQWKMKADAEIQVPIRY